MIKENNSECVGCQSCMFFCPKHAISSQFINGYWYPKINQSLCCNCSLCDQICPLNMELPNVKCLSGFLTNNNNQDIRFKSSSAGFFSALAQYILDLNGVIFAVELSDDFQHAKYTKAITYEQINNQIGSKYCEVYMSDVFNKVSDEMNNDRIVLFVGRPCSISALRKYIQYKKCPDDKLVTMALICHGVYSSINWKQFIIDLQKKHGSRVVGFQYRLKNQKYDHGVFNRIEYESGDVELIDVFKNNELHKRYLFNNDMRKSCLSCHFKYPHIYSDFIVGDDWGINTNMLDSKNFVLCMNDKSMRILPKLDLNCLPIQNVEWVISRRNDLTKSGLL